MKTSFDISEPLLREVKQLAKQRGTTTKSLVEQALIKLLAEADTSQSYELMDMSVPGGFTVEYQHATWEQVRDEIYPLPEPFQSQLR
jgi:metal-responsive CopG/Arc/MetJ family transcriptional regulator